ncbi:hypothetical protein CRV08_02730 [Halarcobacter ebronensis]|uniref:Lipoprotein n=1 Tax=Halarcobacter ebronensis TaxID=1462615 RepID=A0A4Q0YGA9_9BACT|nr:hypothetical protein [Halarcobacter ebronensis]RXJ69637.1 hypothetical protein CRV08_02730 [Halarcobacter ebronensis]
MLKNKLVLILFITIFTGCSYSQKNVNYENTFFIIDKSLTLNKNDIKSINYEKNSDSINKYNVDMVLSKIGYSKLHHLFKDSEGKSFGLVVNNHTIQFNIKIIDNFFKKESIENKVVHFSFEKEDLILFLKSFDLVFKE